MIQGVSPAILYCLTLFFQGISSLSAQSCSSLNLSLKSDISGTCNQMVMTMIHDQNNRPYLYVANKEAGLKIYDISNANAPVLKKTITPLLFDTLDVMNLAQSGNYLYLALGNHFNDKQSSGMAIVAIDTPEKAWVTDYWKLQNSKGGAGVVSVESDMAYLGCMGNGLVLLDVSNKSNIIFKSQFKPDPNYPTPNPNLNLYNARGLTVKNKIVYLCYDAGGIRIINCFSPDKPTETGHFSNPVLNGKPRAYNNCQLNDTVLYVGCDYCGVEILNIKDTSNINILGKWNPYSCPSNNWFTSPVHANELYFEPKCKLLFVATAKSDLHILNVSDNAKPDSCSFYGGTGNNIGTWGVSSWENQIYLSYVCSIIPFSSNWTGVKILSYEPCAQSAYGLSKGLQTAINPNPVHNSFTLQLPETYYPMPGLLNIYNNTGQKVFVCEITKTHEEISCTGLNEGCYYYRIQFQDKVICGKFIKQ